MKPRPAYWTESNWVLVGLLVLWVAWTVLVPFDAFQGGSALTS